MPNIQGCGGWVVVCKSILVIDLGSCPSSGGSIIQIGIGIISPIFFSQIKKLYSKLKPSPNWPSLNSTKLGLSLAIFLKSPTAGWPASRRPSAGKVVTERTWKLKFCMQPQFTPPSSKVEKKIDQLVSQNYRG